MGNIETQINKTLESIDNIQQAEAPHFFETRLRAKMQKQLLTANSSWFSIKKPVWAIASLIVFLCVNVLMLSYNKTETIVAKHQQEQTPTIETFANDYQLLNSSSQY